MKSGIARRALPLILSLAVVGSACEQLPPTATLDMNVTKAGNSLQLEGTTDLPDGALVTYEVRHEQLAHDTETPIEMLYTEGTFEVDGGRFGGPIDLSLFDTGAVEVMLAFQMDLPGDDVQPRAIRSRFGEHGELLEGSNVSTDAAGERRVAVTRTIER